MMPSSDERPRVTLLVTDLDNTLWDWFEAWHKSFAAMLDALSAETGIPQPDLEREIHSVHQARGTSEYSFLLNELPSLRAMNGDDVNLLERYDEVIHVLNRERKRHTSLYPGVKETLLKIRDAGTRVVAYTESIAYWTEWRIRTLELDGVLDILYSAPDHDIPAGINLNELRWYPDDNYKLNITRHVSVPRGILKPDPQIMQTILRELDQEPEHTVYIGDSLFKDVAMAQDVGALDVHARYGVVQDQPEYELLRRVTHWTAEDVAREREINSRRTVVASYTVDSFPELLNLFDFSGTT